MAEVVAAILAAVLAGFTGAGAMERAIERGVRARLGRVESVQAHVDKGHRSPFSRTVPSIEIALKGFKAEKVSGQELRMGAKRPHGKIGRITIRATDFSVGDLDVESMRLTVTSIRFGLLKAVLRGKLGIDSMGQGTVSVSFTEKALTRYARARVSALRDVRLSLEGGRLVVRGKSGKLGVPVRFSALLVARDGAIELAEPDLRVWLCPVPRSVVNRTMADMNPLVDLNRGYTGPFHFKITQIPIADRRLGVRADMIPRR